MMNKSQLLEFLYDNEAMFVEEIDRLEKNPELVGYFAADDSEAGLICLAGEEDSFDWNIVRTIGDMASCLSLKPVIPFDDYVLIGDTVTENYSGKSLLYFESSESYGEDENEDFELNKYANIEFGLHPDSIKTRISHIDSRLDDIYLWQGEDILGFIKVTRNSWHYAEVAIEIKPAYRNQGFGTALLAIMIEQARRKKVKLSYIVESDNPASITIAQKCGLRYITSLSYDSSSK